MNKILAILLFVLTLVVLWMDRQKSAPRKQPRAPAPGYFVDLRVFGFPNEREAQRMVDFTPLGNLNGEHPYSIAILPEEMYDV